MKAWGLALGALGLLALAAYKKSRTRPRAKPEQPRPRRARRMRLRHRTDDGLLDLNSATLWELKELDGIGEVLANRIIDHRPYLTKVDLIGRRVIPDDIYRTIRRSVTVKHGALGLPSRGREALEHGWLSGPIPPAKTASYSF